jgi:SsrA-binding protein
MTANEQRPPRQRTQKQRSSGGAVISNRKARHEYHILETFEAGIALLGTEVKSLRKGEANLQDSYAQVKNGELWLMNMHISPYEKGNINNHEPKRARRLLMQKKQIRKLVGSVREKGLALIPLSVYFNGPYAKVELALAQGKKQYDKREAIAKRDAKRDMDRRLKRDL